MKLTGKSTITDMLRAAAQESQGQQFGRTGPVQLTFELGDHVYTVELRVVMVDGNPVVVPS